VVFFGTEPRQLDKCIALVKRELEKVRDKPLSARKLASLKEQIKGQLAMSEENNLNLMLMMGRSILDFGFVPSLDEVFEKIQAPTAQKLQDIAQDIFDEKKLSYLTMVPE
jgi:predicted Zn-dependent peptidase